MAVSINGVSKSKTTSTTDSYYGVDSSVLIQMSKDYNKLLETLTKKTAESSKITDELGYKIDEAFEFLRTRAAEVDKLNERAQKTYKNLSKLTNEQRDLALEELKKDIAITFDSFKKAPKEMTDFMATFGKVRGAADFRRTFEDISSMSKKVEAIASQNKKIVERNEAIEASRKRLYGDVVGEDWNSGIKGLGKSALYGALGSAAGALGPFSALLKPVGSFLKKEAPTIFGALRPKKRIITPSESMLRKEGVVGSAAIYLGNEIKKIDTGEKEGLLDNLTEGLGQGIVTGLTGSSIGTALDSIKTFVSGVSLPTLVGGGLIGTALYVFGKGGWNAWTGEYKEAAAEAKANATTITREMLDSDKNGVVSQNELLEWRDRVWDASVNWDDQLGALFAEGKTGLNELNGKTKDEIFQILKGTLSESDLAALEEENKKHDQYLMMLLLSQFMKNPTGYGLTTTEGREYDVSGLVGAMQGYFNETFEGDRAITGTGTYAPYFYDPEMQKKYEAFSQGGAFLTTEGNEAFYKRINAYMTDLGLSPSEAYTPLNDAIIYKDNSVYVPHPDDNIVLTKDDVSTPVLSNSFEGTLFDILNKIASNNAPSVVTVQPSYSAFDFSSMRI